MITAKELKGCYVALVTPMKLHEGNPVPQLDEEKFQAVIRKSIDAKVTGLLFAGTTGQSATLSHDEHVEVVKKGVEYARSYASEKGRSCQMIAGAGSNATHEAIGLSHRILDTVEVDALLHVTGYYNNPPQEGLIAHFEAVADAAEERGVPVILYNVPGRTKSDLSAESAVHLARHPNIIGIKEASGDLEKVDWIISETERESFSVVSGEDHLVYDIMKRGGTGVISASGSMWPAQFQRLTELASEGKWEQAEELQQALLPCVRAVFCVKNPIPLSEMYDTEVRLPLVRFSRLKEELREKAQQAVDTAVAIKDFPHME